MLFDWLVSCALCCVLSQFGGVLMAHVQGMLGRIEHASATMGLIALAVKAETFEGHAATLLGDCRKSVTALEPVDDAGACQL
jgi:hypothetical protein